MHVTMMSIGDIKPYEKNPRKNKDAVQAVAASIKEFGWNQPIVVDSAGVIIVWHTRYKAAQLLGYDQVPVYVAQNLSEEQARAYRLADNKTNELSSWDFDLLDKELQDILSLDMSTFGFMKDENAESENNYSQKTMIPQYEIKGEMPEVSHLTEEGKTDALIQEILDANVTQEEKAFLVKAAGRHTVFHYRSIAEYYAHATPEMQQLMERSALVIIDKDNAIANGYVRLSGELQSILEDADDA